MSTTDDEPIEIEGLGPSLDDPGTLYCDLGRPAPLRGRVKITLREAMAHPLDDLVVIVAVGQETNQVFTCRAFPPRNDAPIFPDDDDPDFDPGDGWITREIEIDLWHDLALPRWPATYILFAVMRDRVSAPIRVATTFSDEMSEPAVTWYIGDQERRIASLPVWPSAGHPYPRYGDDVGLSLPEGVAITVEVPPVVITGGHERCVVRGAFRVPLQPHDRVRARAGESLGYIKTLIGPKAVVPVTLIMLGHRFAGPFVVPLAIPTSAIEDAPSRTLATGAFAIDMFMFPSMWRDPGKHYLWALSGDVVCGPVAFTMLEAAMVPRRDPPARP
jgi:hypothetical protein